MVTKRIQRNIFKALGFLFVGLGLVGAVLPVMPTVPFLLVAAFFFSKSSPRWHHWLLTRPRVGPMLRDWEQYKVIRLRAKVLASVVIVAGSAGTLYWVPLPLWARWGYVSVIVSVLVYIWSKPSAPPQEVQDQFQS